MAAGRCPSPRSRRLLRRRQRGPVASRCRGRRRRRRRVRRPGSRCSGPPSFYSVDRGVRVETPNLSRLPKARFDRGDEARGSHPRSATSRTQVRPHSRVWSPARLTLPGPLKIRVESEKLKVVAAVIPGAPPRRWNGLWRSRCMTDPAIKSGPGRDARGRQDRAIHSEARPVQRASPLKGDQGGHMRFVPTLAAAVVLAVTPSAAGARTPINVDQAAALSDDGRSATLTVR